MNKKSRIEDMFFSKRNASSNFLQPVLNVSRVRPRDLEPLGGDFDSAKNAVLRTNSKNISSIRDLFDSTYESQEQKSEGLNAHLLRPPNK